MTEDYPIMLRLTGHMCVIVGGGTVAARKVTGLLPTGAQITVISPALDPTLEKLSHEGKIRVHNQAYAPGILREIQPFLVFASTNDAAVNRLVVDEAQALGALVNVSDSSSESDFSGMSITRRGPITLALSTGGTSPILAVHLRERLEQLVGEEYTTLATWLGEARSLPEIAPVSQPERAAIWHSILASPILENLRGGDESAARSQFDQIIRDAVGNHR